MLRAQRLELGERPQARHALTVQVLRLDVEDVSGLCARKQAGGDASKVDQTAPSAKVASLDEQIARLEAMLRDGTLSLEIAGAGLEKAHPVSRDSCIALTASLPVSRCTIFCLKATENGLVMSHPRSFCRPAGVRLHFGL